MLTKEEAYPLPFIGQYLGSKAQFRLVALFQYRNGDDEVDVPVDFVTDGGSIPPIAYSIIGSPWRGKYVEATIPHDYSRSIAITPEDYKNADRMFLEGMEICKVKPWRRRVMWRFVRAHAWWCLRKWRKENANKRTIT
ncbi:hypothetical protein LCGC14_0686800 [marine sediment metagenome]|uniref:DUF1353 domain-containing protein n=1 Tax=marine sediment metagenome TaxID=412755 RepID=A0A0F9QLJ3_9ZZZZ